MLLSYNDVIVARIETYFFSFCALWVAFLRKTNAKSRTQVLKRIAIRLLLYVLAASAYSASRNAPMRSVFSFSIIILNMVDLPHRRTPVRIFTKGVSVYAIILSTYKGSLYHCDHLRTFAVYNRKTLQISALLRFAIAKPCKHMYFCGL